MLDKRIRQRLRHLDATAPPDRRPLAGAVPQPEPERAPEEDVVYAATRTAPRPAPPLPPRGPLEVLAPGRVVEGEHGSVYVIEARPVEVLPDIERAFACLGELLGTLGPEGDRLGLLRGTALPDLVLLDTETAGLSSAPVFLVGMLLWTDAEPQSAALVQLMARDYAEERAMLAETARLLARRSVLMSYNGRSFDLPMLRERTIYHGLPGLPEPARHLDLLGVVRGRFAGRWEDCRLQTLERRLLGRERWADIEGAEIPQAYHDFVRDHDAGRMKLVLEHNRLDLITMLQVLPYLSADDAEDEHRKSG